jgi:polyvinyl alcohol dehydrogenase (cytochrome)
MRVPLRPVRPARRDAPPAAPWVLELDRHPVPLMAACERIRQLAATNSQFSTTGRYAEPFISRIERIVEPALAPAQTTAAVAGPEDDASEREIDAVVAAGDESRDAAGATAVRPEPIPSAPEIQRLVSGLTIQRTANGGLVIEAPPQTASTLGALFLGWRSSSRPPERRVTGGYRAWQNELAARVKSGGEIIMVGRIQDDQSPRSRPRLSWVALIVALLAALAGVSRIFADDDRKEHAKNEREEREKDGRAHRPDWPMIGHDSTNTRNQPFERTIGPSNVSRLAPKWVATTAGDISATPAVVKGAVYFGDFGGMLWKLDAETGKVIWSHKVSDYTGIPGDISRSSPSLAGNTLVIGDLGAPIMIGIDARTGDLRWITRLDPDPHAIMTGSPVLAGDTIYVGTSQSGVSTYPGVLVALAAQTGRILWRRYSLPNPDGVSGGYWGAVMFGPPAVDLPDGLVFGTFKVAAGEPAAVKACHAADPNGFNESCEQPGSYLSSIVAFDLKTGAPVWSYRVVGDVPWQRACGSLPLTVTWCAPESDHPLRGGDKWDLGGSGPNVFQIGHGRHKRTVVGVGEKSGVYVVLDAKTGAFIWNTLIGPGGDMGGMEWGTAYDGDRIYASITNQHHIPYELTEHGVISNTTVTGGSWAALDPMTGEILWQTADPQVEILPGLGVVGVWDLAPVTVANGVVYASSMAKLANQDQMFALDAATGAILWQFAAGSSVNSGPAVVDGTVYWGSGYSRSGVEGSGNNRLYAFSIDRQ